MLVRHFRSFAQVMLVCFRKEVPVREVRKEPREKRFHFDAILAVVD